ncbi:hypothetical protein DMR_36890 [Solidesulfovibrio magneticus RS-1]|uniref:Uncharacterized protein n=1 Tax=Solidesulfovibrio magneticus (strain ATCC 700980 / DSM 13731 / RS-1) TaxID=573370 RepID=C4XM52_SOLM1|nr:hypothetical protein DMR_36890 [Solidesulfovibrio magneticus RS-1]
MTTYTALERVQEFVHPSSIQYAGLLLWGKYSAAVTTGPGPDILGAIPPWP